MVKDRSKKKMNNIVTRTVSGSAFVVGVIGSIIIGAYACAVMMLVFILWSMIEYYNIVVKDCIQIGKYIGLLSGVFLFVAGFFYAQNMVSGRIFTFLIPLIVLIFISQLYSTNPHSFLAIAKLVFGILYIALPFTLFTGMMFPSLDATLDVECQYTPHILLGFFILLWTNDTFAYLTGMLFGRRRLFERISPKKSWEGFFGGLICTVFMSLLISIIFPIIAYYHWMAVSAIIVVFGVYGDLVESLFKRNMKIKDSGSFLPGHGGILDRFDSVFLAVPMVFFYFKVLVFQ